MEILKAIGTGAVCGIGLGAGLYFFMTSPEFQSSGTGRMVMTKIVPPIAAVVDRANDRSS
jgi:hypothetical protein